MITNYNEEFNEELDGNNDVKTPYVMKRSGQRVPFNKEKIAKAIEGANGDMGLDYDKLPHEAVLKIADGIEKDAWNAGRDFSVEEIQDKVEDALIASGKSKVAKAYITYRYKHSEKRKMNDIDQKIVSIINRDNEEVKQENSNKNPTVLSVQRDYMAGEWDRYYVKNYVLPEDIAKAHDEGIIHVHDMDYIGMQETNCCVFNLEDMLQNGTMISGTKIDTPKSFATACTVTSQIVAQVASSQYGGQTFTLAHLAPFVDVSRQKLRRRVAKEMSDAGVDVTEEQVNKIAEEELLKEVEAGCQTIQYQLITLQSTNGQAPFVTVFMYLDEVPEGQTREDLALLIKVMLEQRILGVKDKTGHYITPAFPKLIYALDEDNIHEDSKYYYLTVLAAKCTAKRMVPDYISVKKMKELKGDVYPCMGCVSGDNVIAYKLNNILYVESFKRAWMRTGYYYSAKQQANGVDWYRDTPAMEIWDDEANKFVPCKRIIRNNSLDWLELTFSNGRILNCTADHPFTTVNRGTVRADELTYTDQILIDQYSGFHNSALSVDLDFAWLLGFILCDGCYDKHLSASIALYGEDEIEDKFKKAIFKIYGLNVNTIERHRGDKGNYKDLIVEPSSDQSIVEIADSLISLFGGISKKNRHIPNEVFSWNNDARFAFLAGMIDADGYINDNMKLSKVQIGSTNLELAEQQMLLAQTLDMPATIYRNHYRSNQKDNIRYRVEFVPSDELIGNLACTKKKEHMTNNHRSNTSKATSNLVSLTNKNAYKHNDHSYDVTTESEHFMVAGIHSHNCRSFLTPDRFTDAGVGNIANAKDYVPGKHKYYGRFNQGVVTINLVDVACSSKKDMNEFWKIFDERLELCHRALQIRHKQLLGTPSDVAPILWQDGALARLKPGETIDKLLYNGYSTISLGYAGLYECVYYMLGKSHTTSEGKEFGLKVMQHLNDACTKWKKAENIDYSVYGTPLESTTYKFAKCLQRRFGKIPEVTDHNYITNSYHICVRENIDAFSKLTKESEFQQLSPGGAISYVEVPNMQNNIQAVLAIMKHIYNTILYAELNTKSDYCDVCGYDGEIQIVDDGTGKLIWRCPNCGNTDQTKMHVARRTCGYIGTQYFNQGKTQEISQRVLHL